MMAMMPASRRAKEAWQQQYDRMTGLLKVYRAEGAVQLKEALFDCYRKLICDIEDRQRKEKALREKIRQLEEGGLLNVPEDVQNFMDYIRTCHGVTCVYGAQYLQEAEETEVSEEVSEEETTEE